MDKEIKKDEEPQGVHNDAMDEIIKDTCLTDTTSPPLIEAKAELDDKEEECVKHPETLPSREIRTTIKELTEENSIK